MSSPPVSSRPPCPPASAAARPPGAQVDQPAPGGRPRPTAWTSGKPRARSSSPVTTSNASRRSGGRGPRRRFQLGRAHVVRRRVDQVAGQELGGGNGFDPGRVPFRGGHRMHRHRTAHQPVETVPGQQPASAASAAASGSRSASQMQGAGRPAPPRPARSGPVPGAPPDPARRPRRPARRRDRAAAAPRPARRQSVCRTPSRPRRAAGRPAIHPAFRGRPDRSAGTASRAQRNARQAVRACRSFGWPDGSAGD